MTEQKLLRLPHPRLSITFYRIFITIFNHRYFMVSSAISTTQPVYCTLGYSKLYTLCDSTTLQDSVSYKTAYSMNEKLYAYELIRDQMKKIKGNTYITQFVFCFQKQR